MKAAIIGLGKMGTALARGIARGNAASLTLCGKDFGKANSLARELRASAARDAKEAVRASEIIIIAVKPKDVESLLLEMGGETKGKLVLSIAAGLPSSYLEKRLPKGTRVALAMPSLAVEIGKGATVYHAKSSKDRVVVKKLLQGTGILIEAKNERMLDSALLNASGIAFFFSAIEGLMRAGRRAGLSESEARLLCASSAFGAGALVLEKGESPTLLEEMVATKKGITALGLSILKKAKIKASFEKAGNAVIREAKKRRKNNS